MSEAVIVPNLMMTTLIVSEELLVRDRHTHTPNVYITHHTHYTHTHTIHTHITHTYTHTSHTHTHTHTTHTHTHRFGSVI